ncbi:DUF302 domain-containing protein [Granulicella sp. L60]|uniref:DUF302 domain-containing protein n=1 Tax=Granulicella sp. L60 TaxID=1641866 RepID=UPI00131A9693|nr:DUF302 domain-containing protein [Granulicella sp. L60]
MASSADNGLVNLSSPYSAEQSVERLEGLLKSKGIPIHGKVDHGEHAAHVGLKMNPSVLLMFGNPKAGTPLMIASPTVAIDLPLKALAWEDAQGKVWLTYNSPEYLAERHNLPQDLMQNIVLIKDLCEEAVKA